MKKFVITILCFLGVPVLLLLGLYIWTDPFRCVHPFDINNTDATNREYLSTELYLHNRDSIHYDSFVFASSRGGGINTYTWKMYLDSTAQPFLFQAWGETLTGEYLKMKYLDESGVEIKNAIILLDIPGSFRTPQLVHDALGIKHFMFTDGSRVSYNAWQFFNYIQKPSEWLKSIRKRNISLPYEADPVTNDWDAENRYNYMDIPPQDSLKSCSEMTRKSFYAKVGDRDSAGTSEVLINSNYEKILREMKRILDKHHTNYHVVLSPAIVYTNPSVNPIDLELLKDIFGQGRVHDYTGDNEINRDINNFSDPSHFGLRVGYQIMKEIYE